jgi:hypothetical protein
VTEHEATSRIARYFLGLNQPERVAFLVGLAVGREAIPNAVILRLLPDQEAAR